MKLPRRVILALVLIVFCQHGLMHAAKKQQRKQAPLEAAIAQEIEGREFQAKILIATECTVTTPDGKEGQADVDTEVSPDGSVKYLALMRRAVTFGLSNAHVEQSNLLLAIRPGELVRVTKVSLKNNRLEVQLQGAQIAKLHPKLKFMFEDRYSADSSPEEFMAFIAESLVIPRFERQSQLKRQYAELQGHAAPLEGTVNGSHNAGERLSAAQSLLGVYANMVENRSEYQNAAKIDQSGELQAIRQKQQNVNNQMPALQEEVRKAQVAQLQAELAQETVADADRLRNLRRVAAGGPGNGPVATELLNQCEASLRARIDLESQLAAIGVTTTPEVKAADQKEEAELQKLEAAIAKGKAQAQLKRLNQEYAALKKTLPELEMNYAGNRSAATHDRLVQQLQQMIRNRQEAAQQGEAVAAKQASEAERELKAIAGRNKGGR
jgi:hypothetical protein